MLMLSGNQMHAFQNNAEHTFLQESEKYLREAVDDEWIAKKAPDFPAYLKERFQEAKQLRLSDKMLILKYMLAALLTDDDDPAEKADFNELKADLRSKEYEDEQLLNNYVQFYLED